jgi:hypothetical protein
LGQDALAIAEMQRKSDLVRYVTCREIPRLFVKKKDIVTTLQYFLLEEKRGICLIARVDGEWRHAKSVCGLIRTVFDFSQISPDSFRNLENFLFGSSWNSESEISMAIAWKRTASNQIVFGVVVFF